MLSNNGLCQCSMRRACYYFQYCPIILTGFKFYGVTCSSSSHPFLCAFEQVKPPCLSGLLTGTHIKLSHSMYQDQCVPVHACMQLLTVHYVLLVVLVLCMHVCMHSTIVYMNQVSYLTFVLGTGVCQEDLGFSVSGTQPPDTVCGRRASPSTPVLTED